MRLGPTVLVLSLAACQPIAVLPLDACTTRPDEGVMVRIIDCEEERWSGSDARPGDWLIANAHVQLVIRNPQGALSAPGVGGGTLIDASPYDYYDRLDEAIPLVQGGWMHVEEVEPVVGGLRVAGLSASVPGLAAVQEGLPVEVTYRLDAEAPSLRVEGATGMLVRPRSGAALHGDALELAGVTLAASGWRDHGGALQIEGEPRLHVAPSNEVYRWLDPSAVAVQLQLNDVDHVQILDGEEVLIAVPVTQDQLSLEVPSRADGLRVLSEGHAPGEIVLVTTTNVLAAGAAGSVYIAPDWIGDPHTFEVTWTDDASSHHTTLAPEGGSVPTGAGAVRVEIDDDVYDVFVPEDDEISVRPTIAGNQSGTTRFTVQAESSRSWSWRGTEAEAIQQVAGRGHGFAVRAGFEQPARAVPSDDATVPSRNGALHTLSTGSTIISWPWSENSRRPARGVPSVQGLSAADALATIEADQRYVVVDLDTLRDLGTPWSVWPRPSFVQLRAPGTDGLETWRPWFNWLDARIHLPPVGPQMVAEMPEEALAVDFEATLISGRALATTLPVIDLQVGDASPGDVLEWPVAEPLQPVAAMRVRQGDSLDRVALIADGTAVGTWATSATPDLWPIPHDARWVVLAAWSLDGEHWASTSPIWITRP